jgi:hypothetical protein
MDRVMAELIWLFIVLLFGFPCGYAETVDQCLLITAISPAINLIRFSNSDRSDEAP